MKELIMMNQNQKLSYRVWLLIFAIVFLLGLVGILGLRAIISSSSAMGQLNTELSTIIQTGIIISVDVVLAVVAIILSIRTTLKSSTYKVWFLIIAVGFSPVGSETSFVTWQYSFTSILFSS
jgi:hypothetical protein